MFRKIENQLKEWEADNNKKALLITGARQIGKSYIVREFGKNNYKSFIELNFLEEPRLMRIFSGDLNAQTILMNLSAFFKAPMPEKETLIFIDEIQECPNARTAIKFLVEDGRYDYIESGSLLGVRYKEVSSYPVGYEKILNMYPMDFEEFCIASGINPDVITYLKECFEKKETPTEAIHEKMLELFRYYLITGGMPDVVKNFFETHNIGKVVEIQNSILELYRKDITKYSSNNKSRITKIFELLPSQLAEKNRRFKLSSINTKARLREYEDAFQWLKDSGVALPCFNLTEPVIPLKINEQSRLFRLFMGDTGLLCAMCLENVQFEILSGNISVNMGSILENVFAQLFVAAGFNIRYLNKPKVGELDFVLQQGGEVIAVEIKSGKDYHSHAALDNALKIKDWKLSKGIVFCGGQLEDTDKILYLPWYMVMFLKQKDLKDITVDFSPIS